MVTTPPFPPKDLRQGGEHFLDDEAFARSGDADVARLVREAKLRPWSRVLDLGCGAGRLAHALARRWWFVGSYVGVEVQERHVEWCSQNIHSRLSSFRFIHVDAPNERYNPHGASARRLPMEDGSVDVFYAFSVFSHMRSDELLIYLREVRRVLEPRGCGFFTAFVEPGVEPEKENPEDYGPIAWRTPLHCVRFSTERMLSLVEEAGLRTVRWEHASDYDGQSALVVTPRITR